MARRGSGTRANGGTGRGNRAFTLIEMLVVISIIAALTGLLLPAVAAIRAESKSVGCLSNLRQIWEAVELYRQRADTLLPFAEPLPAVATAMFSVSAPGSAPGGPGGPPPTNLPGSPAAPGAPGSTVGITGEPEGGLNVALKDIIPADGEHWHCPADDSADYDSLHTSYVYVPGAWMLLLPPSLDMSPAENAQRAARKITAEFEHGVLRTVPIVADSADRHKHGERLPRNVVFLDGTARILRPRDTQVSGWQGQQ